MLDPFYLNLNSRKNSPHYALSALHNNLSPQFVKKQPAPFEAGQIT